MFDHFIAYKACCIVFIHYLTKSQPGVNFINIKRTNFSYKRRVLAAFSSYMYIEKWRSYEKFVRKMMMKLTPGSILSKFYQVWVQSNVITKVDSDQIWQSNMKFELIRPSLDVRKEMHLLKLSEKNVIWLI